jgi:hypothetical protein
VSPRWRAIDFACCSVMVRQCPVRFLVALPSAPDLLLFAKHLFVEAMVAATAPAGGAQHEQSELLRPEF